MYVCTFFHVQNFIPYFLWALIHICAWWLHAGGVFSFCPTEITEITEICIGRMVVKPKTCSCSCKRPRLSGPSEKVGKNSRFVIVCVQIVVKITLNRKIFWKIVGCLKNYVYLCNHVASIGWLSLRELFLYNRIHTQYEQSNIGSSIALSSDEASPLMKQSAERFGCMMTLPHSAAARLKDKWMICRQCQ